MPYAHRFNANSNGNHIIGLLLTNSIKFKVPGKVLGPHKECLEVLMHIVIIIKIMVSSYEPSLSHIKYTLMFEYFSTFD